VRKGACLRLKQEESGKDRKWRDADSNRGHHDFQPRCPSSGRSGICRTNAKNLAAFDGNMTATLSRPCVHAAPAHFLAPHASLSTPHILYVPGLEVDQIQDITGERKDSIQFTAYGLPRR